MDAWGKGMVLDTWTFVDSMGVPLPLEMICLETQWGGELRIQVLVIGLKTKEEL